MESQKGIKERIQKTSKVLCVLIKVIEIVSFVGLGLLSAGFVWVLINGNLDLLVINDHVIVRSPLSSELLANVNKEELITILVVMIVRTILMILLLKQARRLFQEINMNGSPFEMKHVKTIRKIAIYFFVMVMVNVDTGNTMTDLQYSFDFTGIVAAGILWCISYIFEYGCLLQSESDETL